MLLDPSAAGPIIALSTRVRPRTAFRIAVVSFCGIIIAVLPVFLRRKALPLDLCSSLLKFEVYPPSLSSVAAVDCHRFELPLADGLESKIGKIFTARRPIQLGVSHPSGRSDFDPDAD